MSELKTPPDYEERTEASDRKAIRASQSADRIAILSILIAALALLASGFSAWTARSTLIFAHKANVETQRMNLFIQFQSHFYDVAEHFPKDLLEPGFRPAPGSSQYARLEAFWLFLYSEWYATHRVDPYAFRDLWSSYYAPQIGDALAVPSLRYVFENMTASRKLSGAEWTQFVQEVDAIAQKSGDPLREAPHAEQLGALDASAAKQEDAPTRPEAIRRLVTKGL